MSSGYSGTPLASKLGIKHGHRVHRSGVDVDYETLVAPLPDGVEFAVEVDSTIDMIHVFARDSVALAEALRTCRSRMRADAVIWVSWPKKASGVATDISEDGIRSLALPLGLVDVKVCAVDSTWSGLKLVIRKELRDSV